MNHEIAMIPFAHLLRADRPVLFSTTILFFTTRVELLAYANFILAVLLSGDWAVARSIDAENNEEKSAWTVCDWERQPEETWHVGQGVAGKWKVTLVRIFLRGRNVFVNWMEASVMGMEHRDTQQRTKTAGTGACISDVKPKHVHILRMTNEA